MEYRKGTKVFNDWVIVKELGEGANGKVFEIHKTDYGITAKSALKVIRVPKSVSDIKAALQEGMDEASVSSYFQGFVEEIVKEILVMSNLQGHPNIVAYQDHRVVPHEGSLGWDILIRMELLTPLVDYQLQRPLTEKEVLRMAKELCGALEYCQRQGMIHRDIKPENIFVSRTGQFKLGDFGVARTVEKTMGGLSRKGTEKYMAPEVYLNRPYGASVDIYSLGLVLYSYLNQGRLPFYPSVPAPITFADRENALGRRMNGEPIPKPQAENERFAEIIQKACAFDSKERYHTAAEMLAALKQADNITDVRTVVKDKEVEKNTAVEECIEEEKTVGTEIPTLEEEKTIGMETPIPEEEKTIGMEIPVPQEEEKTIGMEIPIPQKKREDTEKKEPCRGKDFHLQQVIDAEMARKGGSITVKVGARTIPVQIQKGIEDKHTLKLTGQGGKGINGGSNGDVYVKILIASEPAEKEKPGLKKQMQGMGRKRTIVGIALAFVIVIFWVLAIKQDSEYNEDYDSYTESNYTETVDEEVNEPNTINLEDLSEEGQKVYTESYMGELPVKEQDLTWDITDEEEAYLEQWIPAFEQWNAWDGYVGNVNLYTDSQERITEQILEKGYEVQFLESETANEESFVEYCVVHETDLQNACGLANLTNEAISEWFRAVSFILDPSIDLSDAEVVSEGKEELISIMPEPLKQFAPGTKITIDEMGLPEDFMILFDGEYKASISAYVDDEITLFFEYHLGSGTSVSLIQRMSISVDKTTGIITRVEVDLIDYVM